MPHALAGKRKLAARIILNSASLSGRVSLLAFVLFIFTGPFELVEMRMAPSRWLIWDTMLSILFFVQHSGMIRRNFCIWLARRIPDYYHGAVYTLAASFVLVLLVLCWQSSGQSLIELHGALRWAARGVFFAAAAGIGWGYGALKGFDPFGVGPIKAQLSGRSLASPSLTLRGPYLWVRHPLYFFVLVMLWASPDLTADRLLFNLLWSGWIVAGAVFEEKDLLTFFGDNYRTYQRTVPMLIPWKWLRPLFHRQRLKSDHGSQKGGDDDAPQRSRS
jgi:methanethiol S-methyltransferase